MGFESRGRAGAALKAALKAAALAAPALFWSVVFAAVAGVRPAAELLMLKEPDVSTGVNLAAAFGVLALVGGGLVAALPALVFGPPEGAREPAPDADESGPPARFTAGREYNTLRKRARLKLDAGN